MAQAKYLSETTNFCPNCGSNIEDKETGVLKVAGGMGGIVKFYQKKSQSGNNIGPDIILVQDFVKKTVGHKTTTVVVKMKAKKVKPVKTEKTTKIIRKEPVYVAKCGLCAEPVAENVLQEVFNLRIVDGALAPIEEPKAEEETKSEETKEVPPVK